MTAPPVNRVAWRSSPFASWTKWHLEYSEKQGRTLCMRVVPNSLHGMISPLASVSRESGTGGSVCEGCVAVLDHETAKRLRLENANG